MIMIFMMLGSGIFIFMIYAFGGSLLALLFAPHMLIGNTRTLKHEIQTGQYWEAFKSLLLYPTMALAVYLSAIYLHWAWGYIKPLFIGIFNWAFGIR